MKKHIHIGLTDHDKTKKYAKICLNENTNNEQSINI